MFISVCPVNGPTSKFSNRTSSQQPLKLNTDEKLGFDAAVAALGMTLLQKTTCIPDLLTFL